MMERELAKLAEEEEVGLKSLQQFLEGTTIGDLLPSRPNVILVAKEVTVEDTLKVNSKMKILNISGELLVSAAWQLLCLCLIVRNSVPLLSAFLPMFDSYIFLPLHPLRYGSSSP